MDWQIRGILCVAAKNLATSERIPAELNLLVGKTFEMAKFKSIRSKLAAGSLEIPLRGKKNSFGL